MLLELLGAAKQLVRPATEWLLLLHNFKLLYINVCCK